MIIQVIILNQESTSIPSIINNGRSSKKIKEDEKNQKTKISEFQKIEDFLNRMDNETYKKTID